MALGFKESEGIWEFPKIGVPYFGVLTIRILQLKGTILGSPMFANSHISALRIWRIGVFVVFVCTALQQPICLRKGFGKICYWVVALSRGRPSKVVAMLLFRKVTLEPAKVAAHAQKSQHKWPIPSVTRDLTWHRSRRKTLRVDGNDATALGIWTDYT